MKKMKLVSEAELDRLRARQIRDYDPEIYVLAQLQKQIDEAMTNPRISDYDKLNLIQNAQHRFRAISQKEAVERAGFAVDSKPKPKPVATPAPLLVPTLPPPIPPLIPLPQLDVAIPESEEEWEDAEAAEEKTREAAYLESIPTMYHKKATKFFDWMKDHKDEVSFDDNNQLVIRGTPIPGSNVHNLVRNLYVRNKKAKPTGTIQFASALRNIGLPPNLISNRDAVSLKQGPKVKAQKGKGGKIIRMRSRSRSPSPPGRKPTILRVYHDV